MIQDLLQKISDFLHSNCRACGGDRGFYSFDWDMARAGLSGRSEVDDKLKKLGENLVPVRKLKVGSLFRCKKCGQQFFLNEDKPLMERIPCNHQDLVELWDQTSLAPSWAMVNILREIGATDADVYGHGARELKIPCRIEWAEGLASDLCLLHVAKRPPVEAWQRNVRLFQNVVSVSPSKFAVPAAVRSQCTQAEEVSNGFSPTRAVTSDGRKVILSGAVNLIATNAFIGSDLRATNETFGTRTHPKIPILHDPFDKMTFVYCDWFDGCTELLIPITR